MESDKESGLEIILDRYISAIAKSPDHFTDIIPALFHDTDSLTGDELARRLHRATGTGLHGRAYLTCMRRYKKLDLPPMIRNDETVDEHHYIMRQYFNDDSYYQSPEYNQIYQYLVNRLVEE